MNEGKKIAIIGELACIENITSLMQARVKNGSATHEFLTEKVNELANSVSDLKRIM